MSAAFRILLSRPDITEAEIEAVGDVLRSGRLSLGPKMEEFERKLAEYIGVPYGVAVSSGTAGLHLALLALGVGQDDEVIVPSFMFVAAANAIRHVGATPVFADIDSCTLNLDASAVEKAITPRTRAIMVVHTFGVPAQMDQLTRIAKRHRLLLIEDACEAIGAEFNGRRVGSFGDAAVFSFYPNKQITTGEGGVVVTSNPQAADEMRALRNQGRRTHDDWLEHSLLGYNYRLPEISCALGLTQLARIEAILQKRVAVAAMYDSELAGVSDVERPMLTYAKGRISPFVYVVRLLSTFSEQDRSLILLGMQKKGIQCGQYFPPLHRMPLYVNFPRVPDKLPITDQLGGRTLALPFYNALDSSEIRDVCHCLGESIASIRKSPN